MEDILKYPACKLYDSGRFRLPNAVRKKLQQKRVRRIVMLAAENGSILLVPVSRWQRNKQAYQNEKLKHPVREIPLEGTFIHFPPILQEHLGNSETIYFEEKDGFYQVFNKRTYQNLNEATRKEILSLISNGF